MISVFIRVILIGSVCAILCGCPFTMEPTYPKLKFKNNSDREVITLLNLSYPDSSLKRALVDGYFDPRQESYVGRSYRLEKYDGLTLFVFDHWHFKSRWHRGAGSPDKYLEEDKVLKKYYLSKKELDSLGWRLVYP